MGSGIRTVEELREMGVVAAFRKCKATYPDRVNMHLLWALQAGLDDLHAEELPQDTRLDLLRQLDSRKI